VLTQYSTYSGTTPDGAWGYFSTMATSGRFTGTPTPLRKLALVY
jgi:hypothetical protein